MKKLERGMVINVNLDPTKGSETGRIRRNLYYNPSTSCFLCSFSKMHNCKALIR